MIIAVDAAVALQPSDADPRRFEAAPGAKDAVRRLRAAGHVVVFVTATSAPWETDWRTNVLWTSRAVPFDVDAWKRERDAADWLTAETRRCLDRDFPGVPVDPTGAYALCADALVSEPAGFNPRDSERAWRRFVARVA